MWNAVEYILDEMAKKQSSVVDDMEGYAEQVAIHIAKYIMLVQPSKPEKDKWIMDIVKHLNSMHSEHSKNGKNPINFNRNTRYGVRLSDFSKRRIKNGIKGRLAVNDLLYDEAEQVWTKVIKNAVKYSQENYNEDKPFTSGWLLRNI